MTHPIPMRGGDEYDALTRWKNVLGWRSGERNRIKRGYNKRVRRFAKQELAVLHYKRRTEPHSRNA